MFNKVVIILSVVSHLAVCSAVLPEKPEFVQTCYLKEESFINCSTNAVQILFDKLPEGVPAFGLESLDPMHVPHIKILQGSGPVNVNASLTDVTIIGFGKSKILQNRVDNVTYDFYTDIHLPRLRIDGKYNLLGRILLIPLRGAGTCWFDASNLKIHTKSDVKLENHGDYHIFRITGIHVKFSVGGLKMHMGNLFDGIKALEDTTNAYLNENWRLVADSLNPILTRTIENIMIDILRKVFDNVPAEYFIGDVGT